MAYTKYSLTPANNTAAPPDGAPEGMLPSAVNDTMRDMMAQIRDCGDGIRDGTYTMTAPKITGGTITGAAFTGNTFTSPVISGGTINNATIGATTATTGKFTTLEATGVATFSAGAVGTPAITTTGDTNTGIFFPAADTIAFTEGGVESMRIDSSGRLGIGTTSPTQQLDVTATSSSTAIIVAQNTTATSGGAQIRAGNPQNLFIIGTDSNGGGLSGTANSSFFYTTSTSPIVFMPNATERMRIDSSGNVGIGTSSPATFSAYTKLSVLNGVALGVDASNAGRIVGSTTTGTELSYLSMGGNYNIGSTGEIALATATAKAILFGTNSAERMRITSGGNVLVGKSADNDTTLGVRVTSGIVNSAGSNDFWNSYSTTASVYRFYVTNGGTVTATNTTISAISDQRFKENIVDLDVGLDAVMALKPRKFDWKVGKGKDIKGDRGFIAQEFEQIFPDLIDEWKDPAPEGEEPYKAVRQDLIPVLVKAIQEQQTLIENLTTRLNALEGN